LSSAWSSTSSAITALAFVMLLCLPIVWWVLPETRGAGLGDEAAPS
jgi:hypothetical protein